MKGAPRTSKSYAKNTELHTSQSEGALFNIDQDLVRRLWGELFKLEIKSETRQIIASMFINL